MHERKLQHPIGFLNVSTTQLHAVYVLTPAEAFVLESDDPSDSCLPSWECLARCSQSVIQRWRLLFLFFLFF